MRALIYVGSYGSGIVEFERHGAALTRMGSTDTPNPSFLIARDRVVYAVNELTDGSVSSFRIGDDGGLSLLSAHPTGGALPCHLAIHPAGYLLVANYGSGSVSVHPIAPDRSVGAQVFLATHPAREPGDPPGRPDRQESPHAHEVIIDPNSGLVVAIDLGLDRLIGYRLDPSSGHLSAQPYPFAQAPTGTGPRHAAVHPSGRWYVSDELSSTVTVFAPEAVPGRLRPGPSLPASTSPSTVDDPNLPSEVALSRDGRYLYVANRGRNTVTTFAVGPGGDLSLVDEVSAGGRWPRHCVIVEDLLYVANERSGSVVGFRLDGGTGIPRPAGVDVPVGGATCVLPVDLG